MNMIIYIYIYIYIYMLSAQVHPSGAAPPRQPGVSSSDAGVVDHLPHHQRRRPAGGGVHFSPPPPPSPLPPLPPLPTPPHLLLLSSSSSFFFSLSTHTRLDFLLLFRPESRASLSLSLLHLTATGGCWSYSHVTPSLPSSISVFSEPRQALRPASVQTLRYTGEHSLLQCNTP
jgi:hypothetical protein